MKIGIDIMAGDHSPKENINGVASYLNKTKNSKIFLIGSKSELNKSKSTLNNYKDRIQLVHSTEIVDIKDRPSRLFKSKPNSSMILGINLLKEQKIDAFISSGNTGCLLASSLLILGKIENIKRPALAAYIPNEDGGFVICDVGANSNNKPSHLLQFAQMSSAYIKYLENVDNPKISLLNIGSEENKGNDLMIESYKLLKDNIDNFKGNIEARYLLDNKTDIVVCDGFTGNIVLKLFEGTVNKMINWTKKSIDSHSISKLAKPMLYPVFQDIKKSYDYEEHGGTPILGVNGIVIKCHGSSKSKAIENGIFKAQKCIERNFLIKLKESISTLIINE